MIRKLAVEFLGTAILVYVACGVATLMFGFRFAGTSVAAGVVATALTGGGDHGCGVGSPGSLPDPGPPPGGMPASTSAVEPAWRVFAPSVRSRKRHSDSVSPSGTVACRRPLACTSGRSITASTSIARMPGATCPGAACSDARAVPSVCCGAATWAAATLCSPSLISTYREAHGSVTGTSKSKTPARASTHPRPRSLTQLPGLPGTHSGPLPRAQFLPFPGPSGTKQPRQGLLHNVAGAGP
jgi:hypothetical protein